MRTRWQLMFAILFCLITGFTVRAQPAAGPEGTPPALLVVGDSLSAEYGLQRGSGWVNLVQQRIDDAGLPYRVNNASISGDTTSGGLSRFPEALKRYQPAVVVIELGSNDALRGLSLDMTRSNLAGMVEQARAAGSKVVLVGMQIPQNYGRQYTEAFKTLFAELAQEKNLALVPFLLDGMATDRSLFQADGIHPNEAAQPILAENVWKALEPLLAAKPIK